MLKQKLHKDQIDALKSGDQITLNVIRYILAQIKNKEIEKKQDLTDEEIVIILKKIAKELKESIEAFEKGKRKDLVEDHKKQLAIISSYLPPELSDDDLKKAIQELIQKYLPQKDQIPKSFIGICIKELKSKADPSRIIKTLNQLINNQ